ncbi:MAG: RHS repeat protein [Rubrivivax sp.]|nr:MAG: RHS repeat protein [Rubrivivax sp.]
MTAIVAGQGLGLTNTSLGLLGGQGQLGTAEQGRSGEKVVVNAATGNLVVQQQDEWLVGIGPDVGVSRTYNSLATEDGDNGDNWRLGFSRKVMGTYAGTAGSTVQRIGEDGSSTIYLWDAGSSSYISKSGGGSFDSLKWNATPGTWTWTDGDTQTTEVYEGTAGQYRLKTVTDTDSKSLTLSYLAAGLINRITGSNNEYVSIEYGGAQGKNILSLSTWSSANTQLLKRVSYTYDSNTPNNRLITVKVDLTPADGVSTDNNVYTTSYTYDGTSTRLKTLIQSGGNPAVATSKLEFVYDSANGYKVQTVKEYFSDTDIRSTQFAYTTGTTTVTDPLGQNTVLTYDTGTYSGTNAKAGQLTSITTPAVGGATQTTTFAYDPSGNGHVIGVTDARGNQVAYQYDANGNRTYERDALGKVVERTYSAANLLQTETVYTGVDPDGAGSALPTGALTTRYVYTAAKHLSFVISPSGMVTQHKYNTAGQRTSTIQYSASTYSLSGLSSTQTPTEQSLIDWTNAGTQVKSTWLRTDYTYDAVRGQLSTKISYTKVDSTGAGVTSEGTHSVTQYVYDTSGNLLQSIDGRGEELATQDTAWAKAERVRLGKRETIGATPLSAGDQAALRALYTTTFTYDGLGRLLTQKDGLGNTTTTLYSDGALTTQVTQANGLITTRTYDRGGRILSVQNASGGTPLGTTNYTYDKLGRLVAVQLPATGSGDTGQVSYIVYDAVGRKVADIDAEGALTEYSYNKDNQLTRSLRYATKVDPAKLTNAGVGLSLDGSNGLRPVADTLSDRISLNIYDQAGRLSKTIDGLGAVVEYRYDAANRLTDTLAYAVQLTFNQMGYLRDSTTEVSGANGSIGYSSPSGQAQITLNPGNGKNRRTRYFYSADGLQIGQLDADNYYTSQGYDSAGRLKQTTRYARAIVGTVPEGNTPPTPVAQTAEGLEVGQDQTTKYFYNARNQLTGVVDAALYYTAYTYDAAGNKSSETRYAIEVGDSYTGSAAPVTHYEDQSTLYSYDANNRLRRTEQKPTGLVTTHDYDEVGNLTKTSTVVKATGQADETRVQQRRYDKLGRVIAELGGEGSKAVAGSAVDAEWNKYATRHVYDNAGRRIATIEPNGADGAGNQTVYYYDKAGRLTHSINALGEITEHSLNVFGERTESRQYASRYTSAGSLTGGIKGALGTAISSLRLDGADSVVVSSYNRAGQMQDQYKGGLSNQEYYYYNAFGEVIHHEMYTSAGQRWTAYTYDRRGHATQTQVRDNDYVVELRTTSATYDAFGRQVRATDARGNDTVRLYDRLGRTVVVRDSGSSTLGLTTTYDAFSRVSSTYDQVQNETSYLYDSTNRTITITSPGFETSVTTLNSLGQTVKVSDARGNITKYEYNANGQLLNTQVLAKDGTTVLSKANTAYDQAGRVAHTVDERGTFTFLSYDKANRVLTRSVDPAGIDLTTKYLYDAKGQVLWVQNANKAWTKTEYNLKGEVTAVVVDPTSIPDLSAALQADGSPAMVNNPAVGGGLAIRTEYTLDTDGNTLTVIEGKGSAQPKTTQYVYDQLGRRIQEIVDPGAGKLNLTTTYSYDRNDNVTVKLDAKLQATRYVYDQGNRLSYQVDATGAVTRYEYDTRGQLSRTTAFAKQITTADNSALTAATVSSLLGAADPADQVSHQVYDTNGRLMYSVDALGYATRRLHDQVGNVIATIRVKDKVTVSTAVVEDRVTITLAAAPNLNDAGNRVEQTVYDEANRPIGEVDAQGSVTFISYGVDDNDLPNRVITRRKTAGTVVYPTGKFRLDKNVAPKLLASAPSPVTEAYVLQDDARDQVTTTYLNAAGWVQVVEDAEHYTTRYGYDKLGQVKTVTRYGQAGVTTGTSVDNQLTQYVYDNAGRQTDKTEGAASTAATTTHTDYDKVGRATDVTTAYNGTAAETSKTHRVYDNAGRLIEETYAQGKAEQTTTLYTRDAVGNAVKVTDPRGNAGYFYFDKANRGTWSVDPMGYVTQTEYDAFGSVRKITKYVASASGTLSTAAKFGAYSSASAAATAGATAYVLINAEGKDQVTQIEHDKLDRQTKITDAEGYNESMTYDGLGNKDSYTNKLGGTYTYTYHRSGLLKTEKLPVQAYAYDATTGEPTGTLQDVINEYEYDGLGNRTKSTEAKGLMARVTTYAYDKLGNQIKKTGEAATVYTTAGGTSTSPPVETSKYDSRGNQIEVVNANGSRTLTYWDALDRKTAEVKEQYVGTDGKRYGVLTAYDYNKAGDLVSQRVYAQAIEVPSAIGISRPGAANVLTGVTVRTINYTYDANHRQLSQTIVGNGNILVGEINPITGNYEVRTQDLTSSKQYDAAGNVLKDIDARGNVTWHYYDKLGNQTVQVDAERYVVQWAYDANGNIKSETKYALKLSEAVVLGAPTSTPDAITSAAMGTGTLNRKTDFERDELGRVKTQTLYNVESATVNADGTLSESATATAQTKFAYNGLGLVTKRTEAGTGTEVTDWTYDQLGRQTKKEGAQFKDFTMTADDVRQASGTQYNALGLTARTTEYGKATADNRYTRYFYGANGVLSQEQKELNATQKAIIRYQYDAAGNVTSQRSDRIKADDTTSTDLTTFTYDLAGRQVKQALYNETGNTYTTLQTQESKYDVYGSIVGKRTYGSTAPTGDTWQEFAEYDVAGHVVKTNSGNGIVKAYIYDANGNATIKIESSVVDLKIITIDSLLKRNDLHLIASIYNRRNQLTDTLNQIAGIVANEQKAAPIKSAPEQISIEIGKSMATNPLLPNNNTANDGRNTLVVSSSNTLDSGGNYSTYGTTSTVNISFPKLGMAFGDGNLVVRVQYEFVYTNPQPSYVVVDEFVYNSSTVGVNLSKALIFQPRYSNSTNQFQLKTTILISKQTVYGAVEVGSAVVAGPTFGWSVVQTRAGNAWYWNSWDYRTAVGYNYDGYPIYAPTVFGATVQSAEHRIHFKQLPIQTNSLIFYHRSKTVPDAAWTRLTVPKMNIGGNDISSWFAFDWTALPADDYEFSYVALDASGVALTRQLGGMDLRASAPILSQFTDGNINSPVALLDNTGSIRLMRMGSDAKSAKIKFRLKSNPVAWDAIAGVPLAMDVMGGISVPGWFSFNPKNTYGFSADAGPYEYLLTAYAELNGEGGEVSKNVGGFIVDGANSVSAKPPIEIANLSTTVHFQNFPVDGVQARLVYRTSPGNSWNVGSISQVNPGVFDWDAMIAAPDPASTYNLEYELQIFNAAGQLLKYIKGSVSIGVTSLAGAPIEVMQANGVLVLAPSALNVGLEAATKINIFHRPAGSNQPFVQASSSLVSVWSGVSGIKLFNLNVQSLLPLDGGAAVFEYFYQALDAGDNILSAVGLPTLLKPARLKLVGSSGAIQGAIKAVLIGYANPTQVSRTSQTVNAFGDVIEQVDALGRITTLRYNNLGKLVEKKDAATDIVDADGTTRTGDARRPTTKYFYDLQGRLVGTEDANGNRVTQLLLAAGEGQSIVSKEFHPDGGIKRNGYDIFGDLRYSADEMTLNDADTAHRTLYEYDKAHRLLKVTRPTRVGWSVAGFDLYTYDQAGNRIKHQTWSDGSTSGANFFTDTATFDALGRTVRTDSAASTSRWVTYGYDYDTTIMGVGNVAVGGWKLTTTNSNTSNNVLVDYNDIFGHKTRHIDLSGRDFSYTYNVAGWLVNQKQTNAAGQNIDYAYYADGRVKSLTDTVANTYTLYEYDRAGNKTYEGYATSNSAKTSWNFYQQATITYDELNRVKSVVDPQYRIEYQYDAVGNRRHLKAFKGSSTTAAQDYWYDYDSMNRFTVTMGKLAGGAITEGPAGGDGVRVIYDWAGRRSQVNVARDGHREDYDYSNDGFLTDSYLSANVDKGAKVSRRVADLMGRVTDYIELDANGGTKAATSHAYTYDADGKVLTDVNDGATTNYVMFNDGTMKETHTTRGTTYKVDTYYAYEWWDDAKQKAITTQEYNSSLNSDPSKWRPGSSYFEYDVNGHAKLVQDIAGNRALRYATNAQGLILVRDEIANATVNKTQNFFYFDGARIGEVGNDPAAKNVDYAQALANQPVDRKTAYKNFRPIATADFDQNYTPISPTYPGFTAAGYTVQSSSETLQTVAQAVWGDSSLWYLLADANGLTSATELKAGQALVIPNKVTNIHNNSTTKAVYNAAEAMGDTSPTLPAAPKPPKKGCGGVGMILMVVVAIVATVLTGGAALAAMGATLATASTGTLMVAAAIGAAAGSIASQLVGMATGDVQKFSWSSVATSALSAAVTAGMGSVVGTATTLPGLMATAAVGNVANQGVMMAVGLQKKFSWTTVAASAAAAGASAGAGVLLQSAGVNLGVNATFGEQLFSGTVKGMVGGWAGAMARHQKPDWSAIATQSFGSALGDSVVGAIRQADFERQHPVVSAEEKQQILAGFADGPGGEEGPTSYPVRMPGDMEVRNLPPSSSRNAAVDKYYDAKDAQAAREARAGLVGQNRRADAYGKQQAAQRETAAARALLDGYIGGGPVSADSFAAGAASGQGILGTPMPMKLGNGGQWVANPDHPSYIVPPVAYQGQDSNFLGFVKEGVSSYSADAVVWGGRNGGALGTGAAFLGYTGLTVGELLPGSTTELALGAVAGPVIGKGLGLVTEAAVSRFPVLGKSVSELWSGGVASTGARQGLDLSGQFAVSKSGSGIKIQYGNPDYWEAVDSSHGIAGFVDKDGVLGFNVFANPELRATHGSGSDMFTGMIKRLSDDGVDIREIRGAWERGTDSVNYTQYRAGLAQGLSPEQSALNTWTGRQVQQVGFSRVESVIDQTNVYANFRRPK